MANKIDRWKAMQASMAIEGYEISDEMLAEMKTQYEVEGRDDEAEELVAKAASSAVSILDVAKEYFSKKKV